MSLLTDIRVHLLDNPAIVALTGDRISQSYVRQDVPLPFIVYNMSGLRDAAISVGGEEDMSHFTIDAEIHAASLDDRETLTREMFVSLHQQIRKTWGETFIQTSTIENVVDSMERLPEGDAFEFIASLTVSILSFSLVQSTATPTAKAKSEWL